MYFSIYSLEQICLNKKKNLPLLGSLGIPNAGKKYMKNMHFSMKGEGRINHQSPKSFWTLFPTEKDQGSIWKIYDDLKCEEFLLMTKSALRCLNDLVELWSAVTVREPILPNILTLILSFFHYKSLFFYLLYKI